jgi:hypothetical protein
MMIEPRLVFPPFSGIMIPYKPKYFIRFVIIRCSYLCCWENSWSVVSSHFEITTTTNKSSNNFWVSMKRDWIETTSSKIWSNWAKQDKCFCVSWWLNTNNNYYLYINHETSWSLFTKIPFLSFTYVSFGSTKEIV